MTYRKAIRKYCLWCMNGSSKEVELCPYKSCELYPYRFGKGGKSSLTPLKSIRRKCLDCVGFSAQRVKECDRADCALFFYRFGRNPKMRQNLSYTRRRGNPEALKKWRLHLNETPKKGIVAKGEKVKSQEAKK